MHLCHQHPKLFTYINSRCLSHTLHYINSPLSEVYSLSASYFAVLPFRRILTPLFLYPLQPILAFNLFSQIDEYQFYRSRSFGQDLLAGSAASNNVYNDCKTSSSVWILREVANTFQSLVTGLLAIRVSSLPAPQAAAFSNTTSKAAAAPATSGGSYQTFKGDGSTGAGWPDKTAWVAFDDAFSSNTPTMKTFDSDDEINDIKTSINSVSASTGVDARFILAVIMQESRVREFWSLFFPFSALVQEKIV